ncbi:MAG: hydroxyacid dehydrogenase [Actinomycetota bacterium]|nr:hydroxyacid dehydrogenase [Actinomycetota bacterium]
MTFSVLSTDKVSMEGLAPLIADDRFEVTSVDDSSSPEFETALATANALIVRSATKVGAEMLAKAPALAVIGRAGVGIDNIDVDAASESGVAVYNAPGGNTVAAAELTVALMLTLTRHIASADRSMREGRWDRAAFKGVELRGKTLGLIGAGRIGGEVAMRCTAFEMDVIAYDPYLPEERAAELGIRLVDLDTVVETADVISCHVPLNDETRGMVNEDAMARMRPGVRLINASRGGVIDEHALAQALHAESIGGAALDVFENEPLDANSPLREAPNLVLTPHLGASTVEAQVGVAVEVAERIIETLADGDVSAAVNAARLD